MYINFVHCKIKFVNLCNTLLFPLSSIQSVRSLITELSLFILLMHSAFMFIIYCPAFVFSQYLHWVLFCSRSSYQGAFWKCITINKKKNVYFLPVINFLPILAKFDNEGMFLYYFLQNWCLLKWNDTELKCLHNTILDWQNIRCNNIDLKLYYFL